jgi:TPR repeat protein
MTEAGPIDDNDCRPRCPRCRAGTEHLPPSARFCPRCGVTLGRERAVVRKMPPPLPASVTRSLYPHPGFFIPTPTDIVAGYGEALYRLGSRYEAGVGWKYHPGEAVRCFAKAARLGNAKALEHLAEAAVPAAQASSHFHPLAPS